MDIRLKGFNYSQVDYLSFYTGPERRVDRRRKKSNQQVNNLFKSFGFEQRVQINRRQSNSSWLLVSNSVLRPHKE